MVFSLDVWFHMVDCEELRRAMETNSERGIETYFFARFSYHCMFPSHYIIEKLATYYTIYRLGYLGLFFRFDITHAVGVFEYMSSYPL